MTTTETSLDTIGGLIAHGIQTNLYYAEKLLADIPADRFAHKPHPTMSHPAYYIGHLSIYPDGILKMIGKPELVAERDGYAELFRGGVECVEQDGRYPEKDDLVDYYFDRYRTIAGILPELSDSIMFETNPNEAMRDFVPTIGTAINFMMNNHHMTHLGQISAWRRAIGLGEAMPMNPRT